MHERLLLGHAVVSGTVGRRRVATGCTADYEASMCEETLFCVTNSRYHANPSSDPVFFRRRCSDLTFDRIVTDLCSLPGGVAPCRVAELVFWAIVGGLRKQKTKEESQPPVRAKVGAQVGAV
jgi:hypothetical protein